jgi:hypothetical protein
MGMAGEAAQLQQPGGRGGALTGAKRGRVDAVMEGRAAAAGGSKRTGPQGPTGAKTCKACYERGWDFKHHWRNGGQCKSQCVPCTKNQKKVVEVDAKGYCKVCKNTCKGKAVVDRNRRVGNPPKGAN